MIYMEWMITNIKAPLPENIRQALDYHEKKYGRVPNLVEHGMKEEMPNIEGIRYKSIRIPSNILLVGIDNS
jgi:hypothetical protein